MKIAICISGLTRKHDNCLLSIEKYFKDHEVDVFCHTYEVKSIERVVRDTWSKHETKTYYENLDISITDVISLFKPKEYIIEDYDTISVHYFMPMFLDIMNTRNLIRDNIEGNLTVISMHYSMMMANHLRRLYQEKTKTEYDVVFRMRYDSDIQFMYPLENHKLNKLNIPYGSDWNDGMNDQFAFGPTDMMDKYMDLFPNIVQTIKQCLRYAPEVILRQHLKNQNLLDEIVRPMMAVKVSFSREYELIKNAEN